VCFEKTPEKITSQEVGVELHRMGRYEKNKYPAGAKLFFQTAEGFGTPARMYFLEKAQVNGDS